MNNILFLRRMGKISRMKKLSDSLMIRLVVWNIVCVIIGIAVFLIPDFIEVISLFFGKSPYVFSIWIYILGGFLVGEFIFFKYVKGYIEDMQRKY